MPDLTEVTGRVRALVADHKDAPDGIWVLLDEDSDSTNRWYSGIGGGVRRPAMLPDEQGRTRHLD